MIRQESAPLHMVNVNPDLELEAFRFNMGAAQDLLSVTRQRST
jgi:hypothetical protein